MQALHGGFEKIMHDGHVHLSAQFNSLNVCCRYEMHLEIILTGHSTGQLPFGWVSV